LDSDGRSWDDGAAGVEYGTPDAPGNLLRASTQASKNKCKDTTPGFATIHDFLLS